MIARLRRVLLAASALSLLVGACSSGGADNAANGSGAAAGAMRTESSGGAAGSLGGSAAGALGDSGVTEPGDDSAAGAAGAHDGRAGASGVGGTTNDAGNRSTDPADADSGKDSTDADAANAPDAGSGGVDGSLGPSACPFSSAEFLLWSGAAPGSNGTTPTEKTTERSTDPRVHDRTITGVSKPSLYPYLAANPNGAAAIIVPGGGYQYVTFDKEGVDIAAWLNTLGISAFILKYRLPRDFPGSPWIVLADAQRAMRTVRRAAALCALDPARIGVIGFSAGGHLASQLETRFSARPSSPLDATDDVDARPAFGMLLYPVISMDASIAHAGSRSNLLGANPTAADVKLYSSELQVTSATPPTFMGVSNRDTAVDPQNSIRFDNALKAAGVAHELHLYQDGGHGTGIRQATGDMAAWPQQAASWLASQKLLGTAAP